MRWPRGFRSAGAHCGIKRESLDVGLLVADQPVAWAGTFTLNAAAAAPVRWCRSLLGQPVRALVVNSGNANACSGKLGELARDEVVESVARALGCAPGDVLTASTGPIGKPLEADLVSAAVPLLTSRLTSEVDDFARSIMTTDTHPKVASAAAGDATVVGVAKGAAMLAPNMATMLAFVATDAQAGAEDLQKVLSAAVDESFNLLSIDACESTNDSVFLWSSGRVAAEAADLESAVVSVCKDLAEQMARDAEGGSRLIRVRISGAPDREVARRLASAVCASNLWRAAVHGADPNWGRVLSALGAADRELDLGEVELALNGVAVFAGGGPAGSLEAAARAMETDEVLVDCRVGGGASSVEMLSVDLSPEYVTLNAEGTS